MTKKHSYRNKILVIGGSGFIGSNLIAELKKYRVINYDLKNGDDIFDDKLDAYIATHDVVIHLAALTSVEQSFKNPEETFYANVLGTARVVQLCKKYNKKLIYPSSAAVIYPDLSPYAKSKAIAEDIARTYKKAVILRLYNVFGPNMNPNSGSVMYNFLTSSKLIVFGDGEQTRDFIHVRDVCAIIKDAFKKKWEGKVVECGTGQSYTTNYVASLFAYYRGLTIEYKSPRREIKWSIADRNALDILYKKPLTTDLNKDIKELVVTCPD
jgi:UDP-glucose 4-epimerase